MRASARRLGEGVYYLPDSTNVGIIQGSKRKAIFVDTGIDRGKANRALRATAELGLEPAAVVNTHAHADHCGGNRRLVERAGVSVYAAARAAALIRYPLLEPYALFGGASPPPNLRNKFLMASGSPVHVELSDGPVEIEGRRVEVVPLPGHSPGHVGIVVDDVLFSGDALFSDEVLQKMALPFFSDVGAALESLRSLRARRGTIVPSHGDPVEDPAPAIDANVRAVEEVSKRVRRVLEDGPADTCSITASVCADLGVRIAAPTQHFLMRAAVQAHLAHLVETGCVEMGFAGNRLVWRPGPRRRSAGPCGSTAT